MSVHIQYCKTAYDRQDTTYKYVIEYEESKWDGLHFAVKHIVHIYVNLQMHILFHAHFKQCA